MKPKDKAEGVLLRLRALNIPGRLQELNLQERFDDLKTGDMRRLLRAGPLLLTILAIIAVLGVGGTSMFGARVSLMVHELVEVEELSFLVTTHTVETLPRMPLGTVHTYGKDHTVKFMIANSSLELGPYFEELTVTVRLEGGGGSWAGEAITSWVEGVGASTGSIEVDTEYADYALYVTVQYGSKDQTGNTGIGLSIWAEG